MDQPPEVTQAVFLKLAVIAYYMAEEMLGPVSRRNAFNWAERSPKSLTTICPDGHVQRGGTRWLMLLQLVCCNDQREDYSKALG